MKRLIWTMLGIVGTRWAMKAFRNRSRSTVLSDRIYDLQNKFRPLDEMPQPEEPAARFGT